MEMRCELLGQQRAEYIFVLRSVGKEYCGAMQEKCDLKNLTRRQLTDYIVGLGLPAARGTQVFRWLQRPGIWSFSQMHDIAQQVREDLESQAMISRFGAYEKERSSDGTVKFAFRLADGALIESVLIPGEGRFTLCLSSQVGCAMGCRFCLTGGMGFIRNLQPAEIVNQVLAVIEYMIGEGMVRSTPREFINNLVFMGMGEPLANYDNLLTALTILMDAQGLEFTERRVTVSTCGIVPKIAKLGEEASVNLAISLHAADDATRSRLMPINQRYGLDALLQACRDYPLSRKKVLLMEYILFQGINDSAADAKKLAQQLSGISCRINLMPFNESATLPFQCPDQPTIKQFQHILRKAGFTTLIRNSRGADISAACGQLARNR